MKKLSLIFSMILVAIIAISASLYATNYNKETVGDNNSKLKISDISSDILFSRPVYNNINTEVFSELPEYPKNFNIMKRDIYSGQIIELNKVNENIWKQPEFYPTWEQNGLTWFQNHDYSRWGVHGYGFFPAELSYTVSNMTSNDQLDVYSFLHTSWGIETWQGLKLIPISSNSNLFNVVVTPNDILMDPTFPKLYENWTQKIHMQITAKQSIPKGIYTFSIGFQTPSAELSNKYTWEAVDKFTDNKYHGEIEKCINLLQDEKCNNLIELRQNKYISGGANFAPNKQYTITLIAI